ncbi:type IV pilus biogenesis protein PilM [Cloacibacillus sp.]
MGFFSKKKTISAGLVLDVGSFRYLSLEGGDGFYNVVDSLSGSIPAEYGASEDPFSDSGGYLGSVFDYIAKSAGGFNVAVNFALLVTESLLRIVNLPGMTLAEARMAFRYEFENYFPFPEKEGVYDIAEIEYPVREDLSEKRFLVAAARRPLVENISRAAAAHGIRLAALEPSQIALERAANPPVAIDAGCAYIYAGNLRSVLILSWKGCGIFYRNISSGFGADILDGGFESETYREHAFSFVREIRSSLQFAMSQNRSFSADSIYLFGPGASSYLCGLLKESTSMESVMLIDPMKVHGISFENNGGWDVAVGLALR